MADTREAPEVPYRRCSRKLVAADIDSLPFGTLVYDASGTCLGQIQSYLQMNGNSSAIQRRHLNNGNRADRYAYRQELLYAPAKKQGVYVYR